MVVTLNSGSGRLLISTFFSSFFPEIFCLVWNIFPLSPHFAWFSVPNFYVLGPLTFPDLGEVALCGRCPVGPGCTLPSGHQIYMLWGCPLCGRHVSLCCGGAEHCWHAGSWGWLLACLAARPWLMRWLLGCWLWGRGLDPRAAECMAWRVSELVLPTLRPTA